MEYHSTNNKTENKTRIEQALNSQGNGSGFQPSPSMYEGVRSPQLLAESTIRIDVTKKTGESKNLLPFIQGNQSKFAQNSAKNNKAEMEVKIEVSQNGFQRLDYKTDRHAVKLRDPAR